MDRICTTIIIAMAICFASNAQTGRDWAQFGRYAEANKEVTQKPLAVLMGDSITDGWDNADIDFFTDNNLVCRGISGQTSSEMLVRFRQDVIDLHPKYVVILAGTNDVAMNNGFIAPENVLDNLISMCELAKANKIKPVLCSITPAAAFGWRREIKDAAESIAGLNRMIAGYADENRIPYVDYHSVLADGHGGLPEKYSNDGVHPNKDCYKIMEGILIGFLK